MSVDTTQSIVNTNYPDAEIKEYLGLHNQKRCFGVVNKDIAQTIDRPFYVLVDGDDIEEISMPMFADQAYEDSQFATIERKYRFFSEQQIIE